MKTLTFAAAFFVVTLTGADADADTWTWAPIRDGATLNAHLARADFARPNPMVVFQLIAEITGTASATDEPSS